MEINPAVTKYKLFVATPMYGGNATAHYSVSLVNLASFFGKANMYFEYHVIFNEALITRARNTLVDTFLKSDCDVLLFIDADIGFNWEDVPHMLDMMITSKDKNIICATYPKKEINWNQIHQAYENNFIKEASNAKDYSSSFVLNFDVPENENFIFESGKPISVLESGTGFMMIHRKVFEDFKKAYPEQSSIHPETKQEVFYYFDCKIEPNTKYYLSEDYMFCQYASKIGHKTWVIPWVYLTHTGSYTFSGSFEKNSRMYYEVLMAKKDKEN